MTQKRTIMTKNYTHLKQEDFEKVVVVTRKTELEELTARFNSAAQAKFYLEHSGQNFSPIETIHHDYHKVLNSVLKQIPRGLKK